MCGIYAILRQSTTRQQRPAHLQHAQLMSAWSKTVYRGPDRSCTEYIVGEPRSPNFIFFGFHRLCINGLNKKSDQPICVSYDNRKVALICNGEIYNTLALQQQLCLTKDNYKSGSDCEVIAHLYLRYGLEHTLNLLDGVYSFALYDYSTCQLHIARDFLGIRPLFVSTGNPDTPDTFDLAFASEAKSLLNMQQVQQFPPGSWMSIHFTNKSITRGQFLSHLRTLSPFVKKPVESKNNQLLRLRTLFHDAVRKRLVLTDRSVACLLSGGLDSTLVTAVLLREMRAIHGKDVSVNTYSIGMKGSVDLKFARQAAKYLGTRHTEICLSEQEFLDAIPETIWHTESFDTTTIRASVGNLLISKYIRDHSEDTVIFVGDVADELFASYRGFSHAPSPQELFKANRDMLFNIHYYDVLRSDRSISAAGLEARVPFGDLKFMEQVLAMDPSLKMFSPGKVLPPGENLDNGDKPVPVMEKHILRKAFEGYLPHSLLYRRKEAFSDGVSPCDRGWFEIIREHVDTIYSDKDLALARLTVRGGIPVPDKESLWYLDIYDQHFATIMPEPIPTYWRHPFCDANADPSARLLGCY